MAGCFAQRSCLRSWELSETGARLLGFTEFLSSRLSLGGLIRVVKGLRWFEVGAGVGATQLFFIDSHFFVNNTSPNMLFSLKL